MSSRSHRSLALAAAALSALLLASCSSGSATSESSVEAPDSSAVQSLPTSAPAPSQAGEQGEEGESGEDGGSGENGGQAEGGQVSAPSAASTSAAITLADVAAHASTDDCWSAVDGAVFDLTSWIPQHPGGAEVVVAMCGIDGSASFNSVHAGQSEPIQVLAQLQVGVLAG